MTPENIRKRAAEIAHRVVPSMHSEYPLSPHNRTIAVGHAENIIANEMEMSLAETLAHIAELEDRLATATRFTFRRPPHEIHVETRGNGKWCVSNGASVLARDGEWVYEPLSSNRDDDFISQTRFTLEEALDLARNIR